MGKNKTKDKVPLLFKEDGFERKNYGLVVSRVVTLTANAIFILFGVLLIAMGIVAYVNIKDLETIYKISIPIGFIILGIMILLDSILGIYAFSKNKIRVILSYTIILLVLVICEFGVSGGAYYQRTQVSSNLYSSWEHLSDQDKNNLQNKFNCCGFHNATDFPGSSCVHSIEPNVTAEFYYAEIDDEDLIDRDTDEQDDLNDTETKFDGCGAKFIDSFKHSLLIVATSALVFAILQLVTIICGFLALKYLRQEHIRKAEENDW